jgi:hypothetical protein
MSTSRVAPARGHSATRHAHAPAPLRLTGRGSLALMALVFLIASLIAAWSHVAWLGGLGYAAGALAAVGYARRESLLAVVTTPPALYLGMLVIAQLLTATGRSTVLAALEGTLLALAATAPWLLVGTLVYLAAAMLRGLPRCVADLRLAIAGEVPGAGRTSSAPAPPRLPRHR